MLILADARSALDVQLNTTVQKQKGLTFES